MTVNTVLLQLSYEEQDEIFQKFVEKYPNLKDKSKLYYISKAEYKKLEKIKEEMDKLFQTKYGEYCSPLPVYATLGQMYSWKYPFSVEKL